MRGLVAALRARCPICGSKGIWKSFGQTVDRCPVCGYRYEREEGYWVGGLVVAMAFEILLFLVIFLGTIAIMWPDVPWTWLTVGLVVVMVLAPIALYPQSKTVWVWLDLKVHPYEGSERDWEQR